MVAPAFHRERSALLNDVANSIALPNPVATVSGLAGCGRSLGHTTPAGGRVRKRKKSQICSHVFSLAYHDDAGSHVAV